MYTAKYMSRQHVCIGLQACTQRLRLPNRCAILALLVLNLLELGEQCVHMYIY
jgi:hypothetical protein